MLNTVSFQPVGSAQETGTPAKVAPSFGSLWRLHRCRTSSRSSSVLGVVVFLVAMTDICASRHNAGRQNFAGYSFEGCRRRVIRCLSDVNDVSSP